MILLIGKSSNLSLHINEKLKNTVLISSKNPFKDLEQIDFKSQKSIIIIFNNFQKSTFLSDMSRPSEYLQRSIVTTGEILNYLIVNSIKVDKVIYTSSSSVYGNNIFCNEQDVLMPLNLHAALKLSNEKLIEVFCTQYHIDYTVCRIFNMYGGYDDFSIISKIIRAVKDSKKLTLYNNGNAIRDFIHIDDVVSIYTLLMNRKDVNVINVGTSNGVSIKNILDFLSNQNIRVEYDTTNRNELKVSTADITLLKTIIGDFTFKDVRDFINHQLHKEKKCNVT